MSRSMAHKAPEDHSAVPLGNGASGNQAKPIAELGDVFDRFEYEDSSSMKISGIS